MVILVGDVSSNERKEDFMFGSFFRVLIVFLLASMATALQAEKTSKWKQLATLMDKGKTFSMDDFSDFIPENSSRVFNGICHSQGSTDGYLLTLEIFCNSGEIFDEKTSCSVIESQSVNHPVTMSLLRKNNREYIITKSPSHAVLSDGRVLDFSTYCYYLIASDDISISQIYSGILCAYKSNGEKVCWR